MKFKDLDKEIKQQLHLELNEKVEKVGGQFNFLQMLEDIRSIKQPLLKKTNSLHYETGKVSWDKAIFQDKVELLFQIMKKIEIDGDMFKNLNDYKKKKVINMLKTLKPITFGVLPNDDRLEGFEFKIIDENNEISMIFKIVFFYNIGFAKEILKYKAK